MKQKSKAPYLTKVDGDRCCWIMDGTFSPSQFAVFFGDLIPIDLIWIQTEFYYWNKKNFYPESLPKGLNP